jgi:CBS domain containing-hemolysin-like protein
MTLTLFVLGLAITHIVSFLCSISEAALLSIRPAQVQVLRNERARSILHGFKKKIDMPIAAILTVNTAIHTMGAALSGAAYAEVFGGHTLWIFSVAFASSILLLCEIIPKTLGVAYSGQLAVPVAYFVRALVAVLRPLLYLTELVAGLLRRQQAAPVTSLEEIRSLATLGRMEGSLKDRTADVIEGAASLSELTAYDVMVPRNGVVFLSPERSVADNLAIVRRSGHSRLPFAPGNDLDQVQGIVLAKDMLYQLQQTPNVIDWKPLVQAPLVVPETLPLDRLLRTFQRERRHLAIVVDEYGGTQGIVTLEDVLEEIVGEIEDESDRLGSHIIRRPDGSLVCRGLAETRKVISLLGLDDEAADLVDAVTVSGFVADQIGRIPRTGDNFEWQNHKFEVLHASARRAERVSISKMGLSGTWTKSSSVIPGR